MIAQDINVTFKYSSGSETKTLLCTYVEMGLEIIGQVIEKFDYSLDEHNHSLRMTVDLQVKLDLTQSLWMADFIAATDKVLAIDGVDIDVVVGFQNIRWQFFKGRKNLGAHPVLKFRRKQTGIVAPELLSGSMGLMNNLEGTVL